MSLRHRSGLRGTGFHFLFPGKRPNEAFLVGLIINIVSFIKGNDLNPIHALKTQTAVFLPLTINRNYKQDQYANYYYYFFFFFF